MLAVVRNPLLPTGYDVMWTAVLAGIVALAVVAIAQIGRAKAVTGVEAAVWVLVVLALPVAGSLAWFVLRPDRRGARALD
jgi:hypothetical protein